MRKRACRFCKKILKEKHKIIYCSNKCQAHYRFKSFITKWLEGKISVKTKNISRHIKRYLLETTGEKCSACGWRKKHKTTGRVPLEVDHKDGNANNNTLENVRLLCPNCHALTDSFRNLNKGSGRTWRKKTVQNRILSS